MESGQAELHREMPDLRLHVQVTAYRVHLLPLEFTCGASKSDIELGYCQKSF